MQSNPTRAAPAFRRIRDTIRPPAVTATFPVLERAVHERRKRLLAARVACWLAGALDAPLELVYVVDHDELPALPRSGERIGVTGCR